MSEWCELLAVAIVKQAIDDWHAARLRVLGCRKGGVPWEKARCDMYIVETWFLGRWCGMLTFGHGEEILEKLKKGEL